MLLRYFLFEVFEMKINKYFFAEVNFESEHFRIHLSYANCKTLHDYLYTFSA